MVTFKAFLAERFLNIFKSDKDLRGQYAETVWSMLQTAYASIGGLKGSGFNSMDEMVAKIPFWKIVRRGTDITAVIMYKDKEGRKLVAIATNGTEQGKKDLAEMMTADLSKNRAFMELSDLALKFMVRQVGYSLLRKYAKRPDEVAKVLKGDEIRPADQDGINWKAHPELRDFLYQREIGGHWHTKFLMGTTGKTIISPAYTA